MWHKIVTYRRTTSPSGALVVFAKVVVCVAGGTLGWILAQF